MVYRRFFISLFFGCNASSGDVAVLDTVVASDVIPDAPTEAEDLPTPPDSQEPPDTSGTDGDSTDERDTAVISSPCERSPRGPSCLEGRVAWGPLIEERVSDDAFLCVASTVESVACGEAEVCGAGTCLPGGDPATDWTSSSPLVIWSIDPIAQGCCGDLDGDGETDNAFGKALGAVVNQEGSGTATFLETLQKPIRGGAYLPTFVSSTTLGRPPELAMVFPAPGAVNPKDSPWPPASIKAGPAEPRVFLPGSAVPLTRFEGEVIALPEVEGVVVSVETAILDIRLPVGTTVTMPIRLRQARLDLERRGPEGAAEVTGEARLSGAIHLDDMAAAFNDLVLGDCECLGLPGPMVGRLAADPTQLIGVNTSLDKNACSAETGNCLAGLLLVASGMLEKFVPDLDTDGDGVMDSLSLGIRFRLMPGGGVSPPAPEP